MTAEDVLKNNISVFDWIREVTKEGTEGRITVDEDQLKAIMKEYAKAKCEEQRKLCYKSHWDMSCSYPEAQFEEDNIRDAIIDAPEPEFD